MDLCQWATASVHGVLLIEKSIGLGGLATAGLINLFVPMCNGRGIQIITELLQRKDMPGMS